MAQSKMGVLQPHILSEIFRHFGIDSPDATEVKAARRNLIRAALTCKVFLDPALDRLWRAIDTLLPLLKLLPSFQLVGGVYVKFNTCLVTILS